MLKVVVQPRHWWYGVLHDFNCNLFDLVNNSGCECLNSGGLFNVGAFRSIKNDSVFKPQAILRS